MGTDDLGRAAEKAAEMAKKGTTGFAKFGNSFAFVSPELVAAMSGEDSQEGTEKPERETQSDTDGSN